MADDLGKSSQADAAAKHKHKTTSWITVALITVAAIVLGFAFVLQSIPLAVIGGLMLVVGAVMAVTGRIMEDYH